MECPPVTLAVAKVLLLLAPRVGGQQPPEEAEAEEWLRDGLWEWGGGGVHSQGQAAQQGDKLNKIMFYI